MMTMRKNDINSVRTGHASRPREFLTTFLAIVGLAGSLAAVPLPDPQEGIIALSVASGETSYEGTVPANVTVRKTGNGTALLASASANTGVAIDIQGGVLKVKTPTAIGKGGTVNVAAGATFHADITNSVSQGTEIFTKHAFTVSGNGYSDQGAVRVKAPALNDPTFKNWQLLGDATICCDSRIGFSVSGTLDLNGHTLTKIGSGMLTFTGGMTCDGTDGGGVFIQKGGTLLQSTITFKGSAQNVFRINTNLTATAYAMSMNTDCPWTWRFEPGSTFEGSGASSHAHSHLYGIADLRGYCRVRTTTLAYPTTLNAKVTGPGYIVLTDDKPVYLVNPENDWTGGAIVSNGVLVATQCGSLPGCDVANTSGRYAVTKGMVALAVGAAAETGTTPWTQADAKTALENLNATSTDYPIAGFYTGSSQTTSTFSDALAASVGHAGFGTLTLTGDVGDYRTLANYGGTLIVDRPAQAPVQQLSTLASRRYDAPIEIRSGTFVATNVFAGGSSDERGVIRQTGGSLTGGDPAKTHCGYVTFRIGGYAHGAYLMEGGETTVLGGLMLGHYPGYFGALYQTGGSMIVRGSVACGTNGRQVYYVGSGATNIVTSSFYLGFDGGNSQMAQHSQCCVEGENALLCVSNTFNFCARTQAQTPACTGIVSVVNGGTLAANRLVGAAATTPKLARRACLYVSGGILKPLNSSRWAGVARADRQELVDVFTVGSAGVTYDLTALQDEVIIPFDMKPPTGRGVVSATLPALNALDTTGKVKFNPANYTMPGEIEIEGDGLGAIGTAVYDPVQKKLTGIKIFAPGNDYTAAKTKVWLRSPDRATKFACSFETAEQTGGGLTVRAGTTTLALTGANTYPGVTRIESGTLRLDTASVLPETNAVELAGGALNLNNLSIRLASIGGTGTLKYGTLTVDRLDYDVTTLPDGKTSGITLAAGTTLAVTPGAKVRIVHPEALTGSRYMLARSETVLPTGLTLEQDLGDWRLVYGRDGKSLRLSRSGFSLIFR